MKLFNKKPATAPRRRPPVNQPNLTVYSYRSQRSPSGRPGRNDSAKWSSLLGRTIRTVRKWPLSSWLVLLLAVVSLGRLTYLNPHSILRLDEAETVRPSADYQKAADQALSGSIFNRSKLTFNAIAVKSKLEAAYPEIDNASISYDLFGTRPVVRLAISQPVLRLSSRQQLWLIDSAGRALGRPTGFKDLPLVTDEIGLSIEQGSAILSRSNVDFILKTLAYAEAANIQISDVYLPLTSREVDIKENGQKYRVKMNFDEPVDGQVGDWLAARGNLDAASITEYIDVRPGEKVYYK